MRRDEPLNDSNFLIYAAKHYSNRELTSTDEFLDDLDRIKYIKKLITRYAETSELKERLILNHVIVLHNVFGQHTCRLLYLKLKPQFQYIKPFLILLNILPDTLYNIGDETIIYTDVIAMDETIIAALRNIIRC